MHVEPFACIRPTAQAAAEVAALPYDVVSRAEAAAAVADHPLSFLNIDRPETQFDADQDMYAPEVYAKARDLFESFLDNGTFIEDSAETYYLYRLEKDGTVQTGFVGVCPVDEYLDGTIKKHENTRPEKEQDRISHIKALGAQTGPIFLAYRAQNDLAQLADTVSRNAPIYCFTADDGVTHTVWRVDSVSQITCIRHAFEQVPCAYVADGHHRAASAVHVAEDLRSAHPDTAGDEESNRFLCVLFPDDELTILPYHRVVADLGIRDDGTPRSYEDFLSDLCRAGFTISTSDEPVEPREKGTFGMYLGGTWWILEAPELSPDEAADPIECLDVSILQTRLLDPVLGITDPRTDERIAFVGGPNAAAELERLVNNDGWAVAFTLHPTSMDELFAVADADLLMPPKSTWFEPKLRSGLFIHRIGDLNTSEL